MRITVLLPILLLCTLLVTGASSGGPLPAPIREQIQAGRALPATILLSREFVSRAERFGPLDPRTMDCLVPLGILAEDGDQQADARVFLATALEAYRELLPEGDPRIVATLAQIARMWRGQNERYANRAHAAFEEGMRFLDATRDSSRLRADLLHARSNQLRIEGDLAGAESALAEAVELRRGEAVDVTLADNLTWLAFIRMQRDDDDGAQKALLEARETLRTMGFEVHPLRSTIDNFLAEIARDHGDLEAARDLARSAVEQAAQTQRDQLLGMRRWGQPAALTLADLELLDGEVEAAVRRVIGILGPHTVESYAAGSDSLRSHLAQLERQWAAAARGEDLEARMQRLLDIVTTRADLYSLGFSSLESAKLPTPPRHAAFVGWFSTFWREAEGRAEPRLWGYRIDDQGHIDAWRIPATGSARKALARLRRLNSALRSASQWPGWVAEDEELDALSASVAADFLSPLLESRDLQQLFVLPSPGISSLPIESMSDGKGGYVTDHFAIAHLPSPQLYHRLVEESVFDDVTPRSWPALVVGGASYDPEAPIAATAVGPPQIDAVAQDFSPAITTAQMRSVLQGEEGAFASLPALPYSLAEAREIAGLFVHGEALLGRNATESRLVRYVAEGRMRDYGLIHVASHALLDAKFPRRSALVLSNPRLDVGIDSDGLVTTEDIDLSWSLRAELLTLSACQTGAEIWAVDGGSSFITSALSAGARSVLASRWKVNDLASYLFMRRFYAALTGADGTAPKDKSAALATARASLRTLEDSQGRRPFAHPVYWSSFLLFGNPH